MNRKGFALSGTMLAILALAIVAVPITKWLLSLNDGTADLQTRMVMQQIITDKWNIINAEDFEALDETIAAKGKTWTENAGDGNRFSIETVFGDKGKYTNTVCTNATPGEDDRRCRQVSIQITDAYTGKTQAINLTKADSRYLNSRMKKIEDDLAAFKASTNSRFASVDSSITSLGSRVSNLENKIAGIDSLNSRISTVEGRFSDYYKKGETYSKSEVNAKIPNIPSVKEICLSGFHLCIKGAIINFYGTD